MEFERIISLPTLLRQKSHFLFGPRATGKSFLIRKQLAGQALVIDLLRSDNFLRLSENPGELEQMIATKNNQQWCVVIDEVQKIPSLLDEVHRLIEEKGTTFLLTGSSARKLKRGQANLLAGRSWIANLFPLTYPEIQNFDLGRYLRYGGLPTVYGSDQPGEELDVYVTTYIREEIKAEGFVRNLMPFSRFLKGAALSNGQLLNFTQLGSDCEVPPSTIREYYSILEDTMIGFLLEPWVFSKKRKAIQSAKFYFFDPGVTHAIAGTATLDRNSDMFGTCFEQWIGMELKAYLGYKRIRDPLTFWRSTSGFEVDFLAGDHTAVEVKAARRVTPKNMKGLRALADEKLFQKYYLVTQDPIHAKQGVITCLHWEEFVKRLWAGEIF